MEWRRLIHGGEINAVAVPRAMTTGDFSSLTTPIKVPQTSDPAAIAKFGQFGLTPGQNFPNNHHSGRLAQSRRHRSFEGGPVPGTQQLPVAVTTRQMTHRPTTARRLSGSITRSGAN